MFFLDRLDLDRRFRLLRKELAARGISEELRGWSFDSPPVEPPSRSVLFGVSELAMRYCPTMRDLYLRRVLHVRPPPSIKMARGIALHAVSHETVTRVKGLLFSGRLPTGSELAEGLLPSGPEVAERSVGEAERALGQALEASAREQLVGEALAFYRFLVTQVAAQVDRALSKYPHATADSIANVAIPPVVERKVDGSLVGLAHELSVDIYTPYNAVADLKTGEVREFHPYAATGYALALEAEENMPVDFGFVVYVRVNPITRVPSFRLKCFVVGDELRREFLELRDEAYEVVTLGKEPGKPAKCPDYCPYYPVCAAGKV